MVEDLIKKADIEQIAKKGEEIYAEIKNKYEPQQNGKYLAIETESKDIFFADSASEAVDMAKEKYPDKVFYIVKIGFDYVETLANSFL